MKITKKSLGVEAWEERMSYRLRETLSIRELVGMEGLAREAWTSLRMGNP